MYYMPEGSLEQSIHQSPEERIRAAKEELKKLRTLHITPDMASQPGRAAQAIADGETEYERCREVIAQGYREVLGLEHNPDFVVVIPGGVAGRRIEKTDEEGEKTTRYKWTLTSWQDDEANLPPESQTSGEYGKQYKPGYKARISDEGDIVFTAGGGKARAIAGAELYSAFHSPILTLSQYPFVSPEEEKDLGTELPKDFWKQYKDYLTEVQNIPEDMVLSETVSTDTFQGLVEVVKAAREHGYKTPVIISNDYHMARIKKMWEYLMNPESATTKLKFVLARMPKYFQDMMGFYVEGTDADPVIVVDSKVFFDYCANVKPAFIAAEDILALRDPRFAALFQEVKKEDWYQRRVASEQWGLGRLENEIYK